MKKLIVFSVIIISAVIYLFNSVDSNDYSPQPDNNLKSLPRIGDVTFKENIKQDIEGEEATNISCKDFESIDGYKLYLNSQQSIVAAFENDLKAGISEGELSALIAGSTKSARVYWDLRTAMNSVEKEKYRFITNLTDFKGIEYFNGKLLWDFSKNKPKSIPRQHLYELLENEESFNSFLVEEYIGSKFLTSPSILFLSNAEKLSIQEFEQAILLKSFTATDFALAIKENLPLDYLKALITKVNSLGSMPISTVDIERPLFNNVADVAVANFDLEALMLLEKYGVTPSRGEGMYSALDIAIFSLPKDESIKKGGRNADKYVNMIDYLTDRGYSAYGNIDGNVTYFKSPAHIIGFTNRPELSKPLHEALDQAILIDKDSIQVLTSIDNSVSAKIIKEYQRNIRKHRECEVLQIQNSRVKR